MTIDQARSSVLQPTDGPPARRRDAGVDITPVTDCDDLASVHRNGFGRRLLWTPGEDLAIDQDLVLRECGLKRQAGTTGGDQQVAREARQNSWSFPRETMFDKTAAAQDHPWDCKPHRAALRFS